MNSTEDILLLAEHLVEGINDPYIYKAVFLAGGPGSGKSFVGKHMFDGLGVKFSNSDDVMRFLAGQKTGWDKDKLADFLDMRVMDPEKTDVRETAKVLAKVQQASWMNGMLGLVIDGTAHVFGNVKSSKDRLESLGYDTSMVFVNTSLDVAKQRNEARTRKVPMSIVERSWKEVQSNLPKFKSLFGSDFIEIVNDKPLDGSDLEAFSTSVRRAGMKMLGRPLSNPIGQKIISALRETRGKTLSDLSVTP